MIIDLFILIWSHSQTKPKIGYLPLIRERLMSSSLMCRHIDGRRRFDFFVVKRLVVVVESRDVVTSFTNRKAT